MVNVPRKLFEPFSLGPLTLRNRTLRAAAFEGMSGDHRPSRELRAYHRAVAAGGIGMTTVAYAAVERSGLAFAHQLWLRPEIVPSLRDLTDAIHAEGALASIQIGHCGNMAKRAVAGERPLAPSARPNLYGPTFPRAMTSDDIGRVVSAFGRATELAKAAGFDAVEVHAGHGYLLSQFLSPHTNRRRDAWGGSLAGRMRFASEALKAARRAAGPTMAVLVKMNLRDGFRGGMELGESLEVARSFAEGGADALVLSGGFVSRAPMYIMRGSMPTGVMAELMTNPAMRVATRVFGQLLVPPLPYHENYFLPDAERVRAEISLPLVYVGGVASRAGIDAVLARGFDAVAMARALIREPDFVRRLADESGAESPCDHCNYCAARIYGANMACHHLEPPPPKLARHLRASGAS